MINVVQKVQNQKDVNLIIILDHFIDESIRREIKISAIFLK